MGNSWIGDTGACFFIMYNDTTMYNMKKINKKIVGIIRNVTATKLGKIPRRVKQFNGTESVVEMHLVKIVHQSN